MLRSKPHLFYNKLWSPSGIVLTGGIQGSVQRSKPHLFYNKLWSPSGTVLTGGIQGSVQRSKPHLFHRILIWVWFGIQMIVFCLVWLQPIHLVIKECEKLLHRLKEWLDFLFFGGWVSIAILELVRTVRSVWSAAKFLFSDWLKLNWNVGWLAAWNRLQRIQWRSWVMNSHAKNHDSEAPE